MIAIYAGSFSPPTVGHLDIITRASRIFDEVVVAILHQQAKQYVFSPQARLEMMEKICHDLKNVRVLTDEGLLVDVAKRTGASVILRGVRGTEDIPFEMQLAQANRMIGNNIETVFMCSSPEYSRISSTIVRDCASHGAPLTGMVPDEIIEQIYATYGYGPNAERKD